LDNLQLPTTVNDYEIVGFDYSVLNLDQKYWPGGSQQELGFFYKTIKTDKGELPDLCYGAVGRQFLAEMLEDIIAKAKNGKNLIIDSVLSDEELKTIESECSNCDIVKVGIRPPLAIVIAREIQRGDRKIGIAEAFFASLSKKAKVELIYENCR
jgi:chloramphenicol 3-O-phosphotransferase